MKTKRTWKISAKKKHIKEIYCLKQKVRRKDLSDKRRRMEKMLGRL